MLWLANQPSLVVATTLVGNNLANDLTSKPSTMATERLFPHGGSVDRLPAAAGRHAVHVHLRRPAAEEPVLQRAQSADAPLRRRCWWSAPCSSRPITIVLWLLSLVLKLFVREGPQELRLSLARRELTEMLAEGHEVGHPAARAADARPNDARRRRAAGANFAAPAGRVVRVTTTMTKSEILRIAQGRRRTLLPIEDPQDKRRLVGFVRTIDLFLDDSPELPAPRPLVELAENESFLSALGKARRRRRRVGPRRERRGKDGRLRHRPQDLHDALLRPQ